VTVPARVRLDAFGTGARRALEALVRTLGPERQAFLVGGAVRAALAGVGSEDLDIAVPSGALVLARELGDRLGAAFHALDESRGAGRITGGGEYAWEGPQIDVADFRASDLDGDLRGRDFTVNALAVGVVPLVRAGEAEVEDPTGGRADIEARMVRLCSPRSLEDDPVRVLRAARLGTEPGWRLDPGLEAAARGAAPALARAAAERVRDEIRAMLAGPSSATGLRALDRWGAIEVLLPEAEAMKGTSQSEPHRFDVWEHSLRAVEGMDLVVSRVSELEPWGEALAGHAARSTQAGGAAP
jgi:poly(A) polymerase